MFLRRFHSAWLLLLLPASLLAAVASAQTVPAANRSLVLLDPAHGGTDSGASLTGGSEKDATLAFAASLRQSLNARAFTVVATRDTDLPLLADARAGTANHLRPGVCLILHASATGNGVHLASSPLTPGSDAPSGTVAWRTAQTAFVPQSLRLANILGLALVRARLPVLLSRAAVRPLDNLTCPAVAIEIAPLAVNGRPTSPLDSAYQHRIAEAIASALVDWRNFNAPPSPGTAVAP